MSEKQAKNLLKLAFESLFNKMINAVRDTNGGQSIIVGPPGEDNPLESVEIQI